MLYVYLKHEIRCKVLISFLPVPSTPENTHGCCDGYSWDAVKKDCVGMSIAFVSTKQNIPCQCFPLFEMHFSNINKYHYHA